MNQKNVSVFTDYLFSGIRRLNFAIIMMLLAIFIKPDEGWGQGSFCGEAPFHQATSTHPDSIYYDRFGNSYDLYPAGQNSPSGGTAIQTIMFTLNFSNNYTSAEKNLCETVFNEISSLINQRQLTNACGDPISNQPIIINFSKSTSLPTAVAAVGSPRFTGVTIECPEDGKRLVHSRVYSKLNGINFINGNLTDGDIVLNSNFSFFTGFPNQCPNNLLDLYTIMMHEAMHVVAFHPLVQLTDDNFISDYDLLFKNNNGDNIASNNSCQSPCYESIFTACTGTNGDCNLTVGSQNNNVASIAHLENPNSVMFPGVSFGERRTLQSNEIQILCEMGYSTTACAESPFVAQNMFNNVQRTCTEYSGCCSNIYKFCKEDENKTIMHSDLLCFAHSSHPINILSVEGRLITVTELSDRIIVSDPVNRGRGEIICTYQVELPNQICKTFSQSFTVQFDPTCECEFTPQNDCENIICYHDFNEFSRGATPTFGHPFFFENTQFCNNNSPDLNESNDFPNQGNYIALPLRNESVVFSLDEAPYNFCELELSLDAKADNNTGQIEVWGSEFPPCDINDRGISRICGQSTTCGNGDVFTSVCLGEITITSVGQFSQVSLDIDQSVISIPIHYIFLINNGGGFSIDNIALKVVNCATNADFTTTIEPCNQVLVLPTQSNNHQTHLWDFGDGNTSTDQFPAVHTYALDGTYTITHTVQDNCGNIKVSNEKIEINCPDMPWACTPTPGFDYIYLDASPSRNISDFYPLISSIVGQRFIIRGKLIIDKDFKIWNSPHILLEPGAEIHVPTGKKFLLNYSTLIEGCTDMWKGITVQGALYFSGNRIKDAMHALNFKNGATSYLSSNYFVDNLIGIYASELGGVVNIMQFSLNEFSSTNSLRPPYPGYLTEWPGYNQHFSSGNNTWAGVVLTRQKGIVNLSGNGSYNRFKDIRNAVVVTNTSFKLHYANIQNLTGESYEYPYAGYGVHGIKCTDADIQRVNVTDAFRGVFIENQYLPMTTKVQVKDCAFTNIDPSYTESGNTVQIRNCNGGDITIDNNLFDNTAHPIDLWEVNNYASLSVSDNGTIANPMSYVRGWGIRIGNSSSADKYAVVANNVMTTANGTFGISVGRSNNVAVHNNKVTINNPNNWSNITGIEVNSSSGCEVRENNVTMNLASNPPTSRGIYVNRSPNTLYCCNNVTGGFRGVHFSGMSTNTRFKQNTMKNATNAGLYLFYSTIGQQFLSDASGIRAYGNIWEGAVAGNQVAKADGQYEPNLFSVDGGDNGSIGIPNSTFSPMATPAAWFVDASASTPLCSTHPLCNEDMFQGNGPWICGNLQAMSDLQNSITGVNGNVPYAEQELWTAQNYAYDYITAHPQLMAYSIPLTNFYNNPGAPILAYQSIEQNIDNIFALTPSEQTAWNTSSAASATAIAALDAINAQVTEANFDALYPTMLPYIATISYHYGIMNDINEDVEVRAITNATNIRAQIASMPGSQSFLAQYKLIRMIYMDYIIHGKTYVLSTYLSQINDIAGRCQLIYGESVTLARGLQGALGLEVTITEGSCVPVTPKSKISDEVAVYNVVPNPSSEDWTANIDGISVATDITYTLTDLQGRIVSQYNGKLFPDQAVTISGASLAPGVYILNMNVANVKMEPRKLIKIQ